MYGYNLSFHHLVCVLWDVGSFRTCLMETGKWAAGIQTQHLGGVQKWIHMLGIETRNWKIGQWITFWGWEGEMAWLFLQCQCVLFTFHIFAFERILMRSQPKRRQPSTEEWASRGGLKELAIFSRVAFRVAWWCSWLGVYNWTSCWHSFKRTPDIHSLAHGSLWLWPVWRTVHLDSFRGDELCGSFLIPGTKCDCYLAS